MLKKFKHILVLCEINMQIKYDMEWNYHYVQNWKIAFFPF